MTCQREDLQKGFEPDSSFYVGCGTGLEDRDIDLLLDPPPDLVIEVEVIPPGLRRFFIYSAFGVPEIWRYSVERRRVEFYRLEHGEYVEAASSLALSNLTPEVATHFLNERKRLGHVKWIGYVQEWARAQD